MAFFMKKIAKIIVMYLCVFVVSGAASAQNLEYDRIQDRIKSLEKNLNILQKQFYRSGRKSGKSASISPNAEVRLVELEESFQSVNGRFQESEFKLNNLSQKLDKIVEDLEYRLQKLEDTGGESLADTKKEEDLSAPIDLLQASIKEDTSTDYDKAFAFMRQAKYSDAEGAFKKFIASNKDSELLGNAYYWLAETYYVREKYSKAAVNFMSSYKDYPKNNKSVESLYKLGSTLGKMGRSAEACATFKKLEREFPKLDAELESRIAMDKKELSC